MRITLLTASLGLAMHLPAQLTNGSFEQGLLGWEWTCEPPAVFAGGAPGGGDWMVSKEAGNFQGCFPSYLFQRLSGVQNGDLVTISGWVRCNDVPLCLGANFGLGVLNADGIALEEQVGTQGSEWLYLTITDTVQLTSGDTAVLVLNSGNIGGPASPMPGYFDEFSESISTGLTHNPPSNPAALYDASSNSLYLSMRCSTLVSVVIHDIAGREMTRDVTVINGTTARLDLNALPTGVYLATLRGKVTEGSLRFVVP